MTTEILQAVTIVIWSLSALLAIMGVRELVRLHAGKVPRQTTSSAKRPVIALAHKPVVKLSRGIGHSHSDQQISKAIDRCRHREVKFEKRRRGSGPVISRPIREVHKSGPAVATHWLTKKYEDSYVF